MKRAVKRTRSGVVSTRLVMLSLIAAARSTIAAQPDEATITQIVNDVRLYASQPAPHFAAINDKVHAGTRVQTGIDSRTELTFAGQALARLSANTIFGFREGVRDLELSDGAILLSIPKGAGRAEISAGEVTTAISNATAILEYHPHAYLKLIGLEGTARLYLKRRWGESVLVRAGQILITNPDAKNLANPVDVDLERLVRTSLLIKDFPPLGRQNLIVKESEKQRRAKSKRNMLDTNLVIFGKGTVVSLTNPAQLNAASRVMAAPQTSAPIPSSTDLGTVEAVPSPQSTPSGSSAVEPADQTSR